LSKDLESRRAGRTNFGNKITTLRQFCQDLQIIYLTLKIRKSFAKRAQRIAASFCGRSASPRQTRKIGAGFTGSAFILNYPLSKL
jgi:hypothetical protein